MKYILLSLNSTNNINLAIIDAIKQAFLINPKDIRFDKVASFDTEVYNKSFEDRKIVLNERVMSLCSQLSTLYSSNIELSSLEINNNKVVANISVNGKLITVSQ